jgi:hypothetical protein
MCRTCRALNNHTRTRPRVGQPPDRAVNLRKLKGTGPGLRQVPMPKFTGSQHTERSAPNTY